MREESTLMEANQGGSRISGSRGKAVMHESILVMGLFFLLGPLSGLLTSQKS